MLSTVTIIDENNVRSKLPTFVPADPDLLPSVKLTDGDLLSSVTLTDGDLLCILNKLANIHLTLNSVKSELLGGIVAGFGKMSDRLNTAVQPSFSLSGPQRQNQSCPGGTNLPSGGAAPNPMVQQLRRGAATNPNHLLSRQAAVMI